MALQVKNPAALRLLIGWLAMGGIVFGALVLTRMNSLFLFAGIALLAQGVAAMSMAKRGNERLGWIIMLMPLIMLLLLAGLLFLLTLI